MVLGLGLLASGVACSGLPGTTSGGGEFPAAGEPGSFDPADYVGITATLNGSGSTFQANFDNLAIQVLNGALPDLKLNYGGGGSGKGKTDLQNRVVDLAGTDSLVAPEDKAMFPGELLYVPTVVAPITVSYHLPTVPELRLDGPTLARIFSRTITTWNDPMIVATNQGVALPATPITVCHRSDAAGTTTNFTRYLVSAGGPAWTAGSSDSIDWDPATQGGSGNAGVAQCIKGKVGGIGYVDLSDAKSQQLRFASIRNTHGEFLQPTLEGASKAAGGAEIAADLTYDPIDTAAAGAYPITSPTWILVYADQTDRMKGRALVTFLRFVLTDGQQLAAAAGYAPLPPALAAEALAHVEKIRLP